MTHQHKLKIREREAQHIFSTETVFQLKLQFLKVEKKK